MQQRYIFLSLTLSLLILCHNASMGCCAVTRAVERIVNADQSVILIWDKNKKRQHFVRRASFKSDSSKDIGFIVPSPTQPDLEEAGDKAFDQLLSITAPIVRAPSRGFGCYKSADTEIQILEEKRVAGFDAVVLRAGSADALVGWLKQNEYHYSEGVAAWAKPYIEGGWAFTALKVAPNEESTATDTRDAAALRISFTADQPLFPYREPDSETAASELGVSDRLLRIYFISDQIYQAKYTNGTAWPCRIMSARNITGYRDWLSRTMKLPTNDQGPEIWKLTEFENDWPYTKAPGDVVFSPAKSQREIKRTAQASPIDISPIAIVLFGLVFFAYRCAGRKEP